MLRALGEYAVGGVPTTIPFHRWVLDTPEFRDGHHFTRFVEQALEETALPSFPHPEAEPALRAGTGSSPASEALPARLLDELAGRRIPVRVFDDSARPPPPAPEHHARGAGGEHAGDTIVAPMQRTILQVLVELGQEVEAG